MGERGDAAATAQVEPPAHQGGRLVDLLRPAPHRLAHLLCCVGADERGRVWAGFQCATCGRVSGARNATR
jgi:hypothetical protein